jgi:hypothetical protein
VQAVSAGRRPAVEYTFAILWDYIGTALGRQHAVLSETAPLPSQPRHPTSVGRFVCVLVTSPCLAIGCPHCPQWRRTSRVVEMATLRVTRIPFGVNQETMSRIFSQLGPLSVLNRPATPQESAPFETIIEFASAVAADSAMKAISGFCVAGRRLQVAPVQ